MEFKMKIELDTIQLEQKHSFFNSLFSELKKYPFGSMPKRDLDCLILGLMIKTGIISGNNRDMSFSLGINETRLKAYLIDGRYKYNSDEKEKNIQTIIDWIKDRKIKPDYDNGVFSFVLEDPVLRLDFSQALKDIGYYEDTSFNRELVKVKDYAFFAFLMKNRNTETKKGLFKEIADKTALPIKELEKNINENTPLLEKARNLITNITDSAKDITIADIAQILIGALPLLK
jgi:hypothetical protein